MNNKEKTKILTISLLCSGRKETTERCLKSLMPIRNAVDSELQIIDTGCDSQTRAIVEKYADQVFNFTWVNDFSAARNFEIDVANGQWLLYIDDDEFFLDARNIIDFFNSGEYKKYNLGGYTQRNYLNFKGTEWQDTRVIRMTSITDHTYFNGLVHEYIIPASGNTMLFDSAVGHYGYVYEKHEDNVKHSLRNIPLLQEMIRREPDELRWPYQLAQEFNAVGDNISLLNLVNDSIEKCRELTAKGDDQSPYYISSFYAGKARALDQLKEIRDLIALYKEAVNSDEINAMGRAKIASYAAYHYFVAGEYGECEKACDEYMKSYNALNGKDDLLFRYGGIFLDDTFNGDKLNFIYCFYIVCGLSKNDFSYISRFINKITWKDESFRLNRGFVMAVIEKACDTPARKELNEIFKKLTSRYGLRMALLSEIEGCYGQYSSEQLLNLKSNFKGVNEEKELLAYTDIKILEKELSQTDWESFSSCLESLLAYANKVNGWDNLRQEMLKKENVIAAAPNSLKVAKAITGFKECFNEDQVKALEKLKEAMALLPLMAKPLKELSSLYAGYLKLMQKKKENESQFLEMQKLEDGVRIQIDQLFSSGQEQEAQQTKIQLETILMQTYGVKTLK